jgi:hypothetical protein
MSARTTARAPVTEPEERAPRQPGYGVPSPALPARADRGFARFLEGAFEPRDDTLGGHDADRRR